MLIDPAPELPYISLHKARFLELLDVCLADDEHASFCSHTQHLRAWVEAVDVVYTADALARQDPDGGQHVMMRRDIVLEQVAQALEARTLQRAKHYLRRLKRGITEVRTNGINDINLNRWKEYDDVLTDSLWIFERRDTSGAHEGWYWGNFIPQIPRQMMLRYTQARDWVLDPFVGSGTTLIECRRLGRHGIGVELNSNVAARAAQAVADEPNAEEVVTDVVVGDSREVDFHELLNRRGVDHVQFLMLHPPYHDIIQFSKNDEDLSNAPTVDAFVSEFAGVVARATEVLESGCYMAVVIGDKYQDSTWIPLGFEVMRAVMDQGHALKSIVVKNFDSTRAKRDQHALWRYRALAGGFYLFKHEYIFVFQS